MTIFKDGDFRSQDCLNILDKCDIVCSNPPFSLAHDYLLMLLKRDKPFLIIGDINMLSYVDVFPYIKDNKMWLGNNLVKEFVEPNGNIKKYGNIKYG
ncbi:MAG: adenine-specific methyltransferase EcoRI family protein [Clostridia bacterium]